MATFNRYYNYDEFYFESALAEEQTVYATYPTFEVSTVSTFKTTVDAKSIKKGISIYIPAITDNDQKTDLPIKPSQQYLLEMLSPDCSQTIRYQVLNPHHLTYGDFNQFTFDAFAYDSDKLCWRLQPYGPSLSQKKNFLKLSYRDDIQKPVATSLRLF